MELTKLVVDIIELQLHLFLTRHVILKRFKEIERDVNNFERCTSNCFGEIRDFFLLSLVKDFV